MQRGQSEVCDCEERDGESKVTVWQDGIGGASVVTCWYGFIERGERASRDRGAGGDGQRAVGAKARQSGYRTVATALLATEATEGFEK